MKKKFKIILILLLNSIIVGVCSVYATYNYMAKDINYTLSNGNTISVEDALNELYKKDTDLIWKNENTGSSFEPQTINADLSKYTEIIILGYYSNQYKSICGYTYVSKNTSTSLDVVYAYNYKDVNYRIVSCDDSKITIGGGLNRSLSSSDVSNTRAIPTYIFGIR